MAVSRTITILGSTGSIGTNTVDVIERNRDLYKVVALTANRNVKLLAKQALSLRPSFVAVADESSYPELKEALSGTDIEVTAGADAVIEAASRNADWTMSSIVGAAGLLPTVAAIRQGKTVALANKETLVCAGSLVMAEVEKNKATLIPVDSEHSA
ncbi:MAG: 1-deoxy-D-xylulose-5-phosphate reductoisomerase, partial [Alphaproteobacteria bacterium]|nr:1-deoxy-D-xylulose-5-phosphate reductoisomerase [Alphaproteobacteria bacterium]